jgi:hypothetical protein
VCDSIDRKHPEKENPKMGSRFVVPGTGEGTGLFGEKKCSGT